VLLPCRQRRLPAAIAARLVLLPLPATAVLLLFAAQRPAGRFMPLAGPLLLLLLLLCRCRAGLCWTARPALAAAFRAQQRSGQLGGATA
jgi:hypothetical protein